MNKAKRESAIDGRKEKTFFKNLLRVISLPKRKQKLFIDIHESYFSIGQFEYAPSPHFVLLLFSASHKVLFLPDTIPGVIIDLNMKVKIDTLFCIKITIKLKHCGSSSGNLFHFIWKSEISRY